MMIDLHSSVCGPRFIAIERNVFTQTPVTSCSNESSKTENTIYCDDSEGYLIHCKQILDLPSVRNLLQQFGSFSHGGELFRDVAELQRIQ